MEGVEVDAVAQLAGQAEVVRIHRGDVDGDSWVLDRARREEGGHQRDGVVLAPEVDPAGRLPALPESTEREDVVAEPGSRR